MPTLERRHLSGWLNLVKPYLKEIPGFTEPHLAGMPTSVRQNSEGMLTLVKQHLAMMRPSSSLHSTGMFIHFEMLYSKNQIFKKMLVEGQRTY
jgi:hypothetical protein